MKADLLAADVSEEALTLIDPDGVYIPTTYVHTYTHTYTYMLVVPVWFSSYVGEEGDYISLSP